MVSRPLAIMLLMLSFLLAGQEGSVDGDVTGPRSPALTTEESENALEFAKEHHPQLHSLMIRLGRRDQVEYEKALTDVSKASQKLARLKDRDPQRYEVELSLWKVDSRIRLLAARMASSAGSALDAQLRTLLHEQSSLQHQRLELERKRLTARLEKVDEQMKQLSSDREALVEKEVERLQRSVRSRTTKVSRKSPAAPPQKSQDNHPTDGAKTPTPPPAPPKSQLDI